MFVLFKELHADKKKRQPGEAVNSTIKEDPNGWIPGTAEAKHPNNPAMLSTLNKPATEITAWGSASNWNSY